MENKQDFLYDYSHARTGLDMVVIYAVHSKNRKKVIETFIDFIPSKPLRLFSYSVIFKRKITQYEIDCIRAIENEDIKLGCESSRFNRRFWCHSYKTLGQLIDEERNVKIDDEMIAKIAENLSPYFQAINKQIELF